MGNVRHMILQVEADSIGAEMEMEPGDELCSINGQEVKDVFDYQYLINDEYLEMVIRKPDGEEWELIIEKDEDANLGIVFENEFMDGYRSCQNRCIFCFIDQMPKGMRETLYFKDDDSRLSFLQGNYVTLTNMNQEDIDRIIRYHLSPINISFHTTNPDLRVRMLGNKFAGEIFDKVRKLYDGEIQMNGQIVLCKGLNDGEELARTIADLTKYLPFLGSISVVPAGLTKYREGLHPLEDFTPRDAREVIHQVNSWQERLYETWGQHFVHCSDEWYILGGVELPEDERYDGFPQLENGVGMLRLLETELTDALENIPPHPKKHTISMATGKLAFHFMKEYITMIQEYFPEVIVHLYQIENNFFGSTITVSGLITGGDLKAQLAGENLGECLLLPCNMMRAGEQVFLDDVTVKDLSRHLGIPIKIVAEGGQAFLDAVLLEEQAPEYKRRQIYEQTDCSSCRTT